jgi:hypothetical protein
MQNFQNKLWRILSLGLSFLLLSGCLVTPVKDTSKFYALGLHSLPQEPSPEQNYEILEEQPFKIDFQVTSLPSYLRKSQLMVQISKHEVQFNEFHRWAEPLEAGLTRIILPLLRNAILEAHRHRNSSPETTLADSSNGNSPPSPSLSPKTLKVKLSIEELKVDLSRQDILLQGSTSIGYKKRNGTPRPLTGQESFHHLTILEKLPDVVMESTLSWEKVVEALEGILKNLGNRIASLCSQYIIQNNL